MTIFDVKIWLHVKSEWRSLYFTRKWSLNFTFCKFLEHSGLYFFVLINNWDRVISNCVSFDAYFSRLLPSFIGRCCSCQVVFYFFMNRWSRRSIHHICKERRKQVRAYGPKVTERLWSSKNTLGKKSNVLEFFWCI